MLNPFDLRTVLLAKHAQHVVLMHFPIALYLSGTLFEFAGRIWRKPGCNANFGEVARWNFLSAAVMSIPTALTGVIAWQWALQGKHLKGLLRLHLILGCAVVCGLWLTVWLRSRLAEQGRANNVMLLATELVVCLVVTVTGHVGGFLSGVNGP